MELVGEEKKIQALFSEVRLADEQITPSFAGVWNRAQAKTVRTQRAFNLSFVAATALLVCALVSLAWWVKHSQPQQGALIATAPPITNGGSIKVVQPARIDESAPPSGPHVKVRPRVPKSSTQREALLIGRHQQSLSTRAKV